MESIIPIASAGYSALRMMQMCENVRLVQIVESVRAISSILEKHESVAIGVNSDWAASHAIARCKKVHELIDNSLKLLNEFPRDELKTRAKEELLLVSETIGSIDDSAAEIIETRRFEERSEDVAINFIKERLFAAWNKSGTSLERIRVGLQVAAADCDPTTKDDPKKLRLVLMPGPSPWVQLDGRPFLITSRQATIFELLLNNVGEYVSLSDHKLKSRDLEGLVPELKELIDRKTGAGTRLLL